MSAAFLSMLDSTPSAVIHVEKFPADTLGCFTEHCSREVVKRCAHYLRRNTTFVMSDLLLAFNAYGLLQEDDFLVIRCGYRHTKFHMAINTIVTL